MYAATYCDRNQTICTLLNHAYNHISCENTSLIVVWYILTTLFIRESVKSVSQCVIVKCLTGCIKQLLMIVSPVFAFEGWQRGVGSSDVALQCQGPQV